MAEGSDQARNVELVLRDAVLRQHARLSRHARTHTLREQLSGFEFWARRKQWAALAAQNTAKSKKRKFFDGDGRTAAARTVTTKKRRETEGGGARATASVASTAMEQQFQRWNVADVADDVMRMFRQECAAFVKEMRLSTSELRATILAACAREREMEDQLVTEHNARLANHLLQVLRKRGVRPLREVVDCDLSMDAANAVLEETSQLLQNPKFIQRAATFLFHLVLNFPLGRDGMHKLVLSWRHRPGATWEEWVVMVTLTAKLMQSWTVCTKGIQRHICHLISIIGEQAAATPPTSFQAFLINDAAVSIMALLDDMESAAYETNIILTMCSRTTLQIRFLEQTIAALASKSHRALGIILLDISSFQKKAASHWMVLGATKWAFNVNMARRLAHANVKLGIRWSGQALLGGEVLEALEQVVDRKTLARWRSPTATEAPADRTAPLRIFYDALLGPPLEKTPVLHHEQLAYPFADDGVTPAVAMQQSVRASYCAGGEKVDQPFTRHPRGTHFETVAIRTIPSRGDSRVTRCCEMVIVIDPKFLKSTQEMPVVHTHACFDMSSCDLTISALTLLQFACKRTCIPWTLARINTLTFHQEKVETSESEGDGNSATHKRGTKRKRVNISIHKAKVEEALRGRDTWNWPDAPLLLRSLGRQRSARRKVQARWVTTCALHTLMAEAQAVHSAGWTVTGTCEEDSVMGQAGVPSAWCVLQQVWEGHFGSRLPSVLFHFRHMVVRPRAMTFWGTGAIERRMVKPVRGGEVPLAFFHKPRSFGEGIHQPLLIPIKVTFHFQQISSQSAVTNPLPPTQAQWDEWILHGAPTKTLTEIASTPELLLDEDDGSDGSECDGSDDSSELLGSVSSSLSPILADDDDFSTESLVLTVAQQQEKKRAETVPKTILHTALRLRSAVDPNVFEMAHVIDMLGGGDSPIVMDEEQVAM